MNWYIRAVSVKHTYRYAHRYAQDTDKFISDMHSAYRIHTELYQPVSACICMYHKLIRAVSSAYVYVCRIHSTHIQADTHRYALMRGVHICMYLPVLLS